MKTIKAWWDECDAVEKTCYSVSIVIGVFCAAVFIMACMTR